MVTAEVSIAEVENARRLLDQVIDRCSKDRWAEFPKDVREVIAKRGAAFGVVLMGLDGYFLEEHLRVVDTVLKNNPGLSMRAVVSDSLDSIVDEQLIRSRGWTFLTTTEFFDRSSEFADCVVVDRYCTFIPAIKYKARLRQAKLPVLRFEQFMNMPGLQAAVVNYKIQSDFMLEHLGDVLALVPSFADAKSEKVLYNVLAGFIGMNFVYFALSCDDHKERYFSSDVGFRFTDQEVLADVGALDGSESIIFAEKMHRRFKAIHAFEPDKLNFRKLSRKMNQYIAQYGAMNILCHNFGAYDRNDYLSFTGTDYAISVSGQRAENGKGLLMARLDDVLDDMTYLRLEAEGSEEAALRGAKGLIQATHPKLAVSVYHRPDDFLVLPKLIREFNPEYSFKLRHQSLEPGVLTLYCQ